MFLLKRRKEGIGISDAFVYENVYNSKVYILLSLWFELLNMIHNLINRKTCQEVSKGGFPCWTLRGRGGLLTAKH